MSKFRVPDATAQRNASYDPEFFSHLAPIEDLHFWFVARNELISRIVTRLAATLPPNGRILEVGCGTGNVLRWLQKACPRRLVLGMDAWAEGLRYARQRTCCYVIRADMRHPPFRQAFHLIGMFDVLEHVPDDEATLRALGECLEPGGKLILTVPARRALWSYFDEASGHCRRYERCDVEQKLRAAGYTIEFISEFMMLLFPLLWGWRKIRGRRPVDPPRLHQAALRDFRTVPVLNKLLAWALGWEARWVAAGRTLPFGTSLLAVARR